MWDTSETSHTRLSHDMQCPRCGHAVHTYLPCSDSCDCVPDLLPGDVFEPAGSGVRVRVA